MLAGRHIQQLSFGLKMRVSIARAPMLQPTFLLLKEPFGALDEITRGQFKEHLLAIHAPQRWTAFFVTHSVVKVSRHLRTAT